MEDKRITEALDILSEIQRLLFQRKRLMEQYLSLPMMRVLLWLWGIVSTALGVWLFIDGEGFLMFWKKFSSWGLILLIILFVGTISWIKITAWKILSPSESAIESIFSALGKALLSILAVETVIFVVLHVWIVLHAPLWYLFPLWAIWVGLVYMMYGVFLSLGRIKWPGGWLILGGLITLFWSPTTFAQGSKAFLFVFGLPFLALAAVNELLFRLRK
ncbi:hypothetical protein [Thermospira aquatica]|uniref:DUF2157 domain-containing protein n=1 Tax=Thermospira aquatica TaxID=2828656 RepID=A0AAX3BEE5_9SPIR|nr:hypothetical protein [Thermospira aquatica]URA10682.1 hypothetical protein KDW03_02450 [Thermospira aquatica]